jgi:hypothetical protein
MRKVMSFLCGVCIALAIASGMVGYDAGAVVCVLCAIVLLWATPDRIGGR